MIINQNDLAPDFTLPSTSGQMQSLQSLRGQNLVLFFYPKDDTPGCTTESLDFSSRYADFKAQNAEILGVSRDSIKSHIKFKDKFEMPFDLLSDEDEAVCRAYDVIKLKNMYGKEFLGIERSSFLIDSNGHIAKSWRKVKVKGHVDEVYAALCALNAQAPA